MLKPTSKSEISYTEKFIPGKSEQFRGDVPFSDIFSSSSEEKIIIKEKLGNEKREDSKREKKINPDYRDDINASDVQRNEPIENTLKNTDSKKTVSSETNKTISDFGDSKQSNINDSKLNTSQVTVNEKNNEGHEIKGFRKLSGVEKNTSQKEIASSEIKNIQNEPKVIQQNTKDNLTETGKMGTSGKVSDVLDNTPIQTDSGKKIEDILKMMGHKIVSNELPKEIDLEKLNVKNLENSKKSSSDSQMKFTILNEKNNVQSEKISAESVLKDDTQKKSYSKISDVTMKSNELLKTDSKPDNLKVNQADINDLKTKFDNILSGKYEKEFSQEGIKLKSQQLPKLNSLINAHVKTDSKSLNSNSEKQPEASDLNVKISAEKNTNHVLPNPIVSEGLEAKSGSNMGIKDKISEIKINSGLSNFQNHSSGSELSSNTPKQSISFTNHFQSFNETVKSSSHTEIANKILKVMTLYKNSRPIQTMFKVDGGAFGKMDIKFDSVKDGTKIVISVEQESQQHALQKALSSIKEVLENKGLDFVSIETQLQEDQKQTEQQNRNKNGLPKLNKTEIEELLNFDEPNSVNTMRDFGYNTMEITI